MPRYAPRPYLRHDNSRGEEEQEGSGGRRPARARGEEPVACPVFVLEAVKTEILPNNGDADT